ncbi:hypothetical protein G6O67_003404 [Ophiocordyceps sinensis]|uniref:ABC transporter, transmembrane domain, type 1 n=3 Tax=Ophiocordyceps sinensis TaxID=72228 RepID=A0A8H4V8A5_9HYPO|nr:hypothetical protein G6O67_003404 [Ophiocordyceps sinensis]
MPPFDALLSQLVVAFKVPNQISWLGGVRVVSGASLIGSDTTILYLSTALSVAILLLYALHRKILSFSPPWLQPFAKEQGPVPAQRKAWTHWTLLLGIVCLAGLVLAVIPACLNPKQPVAVLEICPWLVAVLVSAFERPTKTPRILLLQYLFILTAGLATYSVQFLDHSLRALDPYRVARIVLAGAAIVFIGLMPLRNPAWDTQNIGNPKLPPSHHVRSPEDNLSLFRFWAMTWIYPLARICRHKDITVEEVWQLPLEFQHTRLYVAFRELRGKLIPRLIQANGLDLFIATALVIVDTVTEVFTIRLTSRLYRALDVKRPEEAVFWCLVMLALDAMRQVCKTTSSWYSRKAYERSRGETFIGLFSKLLTRAVPGSDVTETGPADKTSRVTSRFRRLLSRCCVGRQPSLPTAQQQQPQRSAPASNAKVVNLVRGDTYEISQRFWDLPKLISQPIKILVTMYFLVDIMGWSSSVGFALMAVVLTMSSLLVRHVIKLERQRTAYSDKRAQAVAHFVEASRALKLNGWTDSWRRRIIKFRDFEMRKRLEIARVTAAIATINVAGGVSYPLASICLYTLVLRRGLPNSVIWPSLQLFGQLETSVKLAFDLISAYWKATIPVERVNKFMAEQDRDESSLNSVSACDIEFHDASFFWPSTDSTVLDRLNLRFGRGLTIVRGKVGSGKSSLLLAALNEMQLHQGRLVRPNEPIGYAQQLPFLQSQTIRESIVFHQNFDAARYRQVILACALAPDLAVFPDGDQTKLEEGGVGLSGGQKARVALARAVYSPCRVLLLDDPLAALDHDTASNIVRRFLQGPLAKGRTIVMVTHRDDLVLRIADQVIDMDNGHASILSREQIRTELEHPYHAFTEAAHSAETDSSHDGAHDDEVAVVQDAPEEPAETGSVSLTVYLSYVEAGGLYLWLMLAFFYGASRYCDVARAWLLESWGHHTAFQSQSASARYWNLPNPEHHPRVWLGVLGGLSAGQVVMYAAAQLTLAKVSVDAAQALFRVAVDRVSKATFRYHDTTPTGQLKNRLISDMGMIDGGIMAPLESFVFHLIALVLSTVGIATQQPILLIILGAVVLLFVYVFRIYTPVSRCLRRMETRYLTPIIANIGVMQDGLVTIRALRVEGHFHDRHLDAVDDFQKQDHFFWSMNFWLDFRLSMSSACTRALLTLAMVWFETPASAVGFVLTQTITAITCVQQLCEKFAQLQLDAVSLERVNMLNRIPEEPPGDDEPPEDWPRPCDDVKFDSVSFRYDEGLPTVLEKVSFNIPGGSTCAVLGRTGSGKSTIANALLVTQTACEGVVTVGGIDLARVKRAVLRRRLTFIQQDPTLFPGTLHDNFDPEGNFSDRECLAAIHRVLGPSWSLDSPIDAGGKNLSQGQRQLVSIGRAVLRRSGLVILDEATASIDRGTAAEVQRILRQELADSTVITIAHRLEAVEHANWCLRLDRGYVLECGPAKNSSTRTKAPEE